MRRAAAALTTAAAASLIFGGVWWYCLKEWVAWHDFAESFIQEDGRVIDYGARDRSTSEGQAYALFFALVADDSRRFQNLLRWTEDNLAQGNLHENLPAWLWGIRDDGSWGVIDSNPASDSDLWIAYALLEAGRLWERPDYVHMADSMLAQIKEREVELLPRLGPMLLPAPEGFHRQDGSWRLNPSYLPGFILARLAEHDPAGPWAGIQVTAHQLLKLAAPMGLVPDWYIVNAQGEVREDDQTGPLGSYEAIRYYLWTGLWPAHATDPWFPVRGLVTVLERQGYMPERINTRTGESENVAPAGFAGALLPYLQNLEDSPMYQQLSTRFKGRVEDDNARDDYYDRVLILFGSGWFENRYRIVGHGRTSPRWSRNCCEKLH